MWSKTYSTTVKGKAETNMAFTDLTRQLIATAAHV